MSRERLRQTIRLSGGVRPVVKKLSGGGGCDMDLGGGTFDEFIINLTDEQARAVRDKLVLAYGLPAEVAGRVRLLENPNRPMATEALPQAALDLIPYLTYRWRRADTYVRPDDTPTLKAVPGLLHMLVNAGLAEKRDTHGWREWRKRKLKVSELSPKAFRAYSAIQDWGWKDVGVIARDAKMTEDDVIACLPQLVDGGLVIQGGAEGDHSYQRRDEDPA